MKKKWLFPIVLLFNIGLFLLLDQLYGLLIPGPASYLNTANQYSSNYRNYFTRKYDHSGAPFYWVEDLSPVDLKYENRDFPKKSLKVLGLGDSFTQGQGVKSKDTWIKQLEVLHQGQKVYGINFGEKGAGIPDIYANFKKAMKSYSPDLVVYAYVLNDPFNHPERPILLDEDKTIENDSGIFYDFINLRTRNFDLNRHGLLSLIYNFSPIGRSLIRAMEIKKISKNTMRYYKELHDPLINREGLSLTFDLINQMKELSEQKGSRFLVMIFPLFIDVEKNYPFSDIHQFLAESLTSKKIDTLDLFPYYQKIQSQALWVHPVDQHPNDYAHKIAALALDGWMNKHNLR